MKKSYLMMAAAATMFAACTQSDFVNLVPETEQAIGFETYSNKVTRATQNLEKAHESFGVRADMVVDGTPTSIMNNYRVNFVTPNWVYAGVVVGGNTQVLRYWNKNATYKFYAYAPFSEGVSIATDGKVTIPSAAYAGTQNIQATFSTTATDAVFSTNTDWMIATAQESVSGATGGTVTEVFNHIMSKLDVVVTTSGDEKVNVTYIKVKGLPTTGGYDGTKWTATGATADIEGVVDGDVDVENGTSYYTIQSLLIPTTAASLTIDIKYEIDGIKYDYKDIPVTALTSFAAGTQYTLTASIGLSPIVFDAVYSDWTDDSSPSVSIQ